jgi:hypothetical protein
MFDQINSNSPPLPHFHAFTTALHATTHGQSPRAAREQTSSSCSYATADEEPSSAKPVRKSMHESETDMDITPSYVSIDEHKRVLRDNAMMSEELQRRNEEVRKTESEAKVATTAFRTLAE